MRTLRRSAFPYLLALVISAMVTGYVTYLQNLPGVERITLKAQPLPVVVELALFPVVLVLWLLYDGFRRPTRALAVPAILLGIVWVWAVVASRLHGDQFTYTAFLFLPVLAMVVTKPPTADQAWRLIIVLGWLIVAVLVITRLLELMGVIPLYFVPPDVIEWEKDKYALPISSFFGLDQRWPGPFGYNSKTGFMGVVLVLIGASRWTRSSWVFIPVGLITMLLTAGRMPQIVLASGLLVLIVFTQRSPLGRIPVWVRAVASVVVIAAIGVVFLFTGVGSTGRIGDNGYWVHFLDLWKTSPGTGVGMSGVQAAFGVGYGPHNMYVQALAVTGVIGLVTLVAALLAMGWTALRAALLGWVGPLCLMVAYAVANCFDVLHNDWYSHSEYTVLLLLALLSAAGRLASGDSTAPESVGEAVGARPRG